MSKTHSILLCGILLCGIDRPIDATITMRREHSQFDSSRRYHCLLWTAAALMLTGGCSSILPPQELTAMSGIGGVVRRQQVNKPRPLFAPRQAASQPASLASSTPATSQPAIAKAATSQPCSPGAPQWPAGATSRPSKTTLVAGMKVQAPLHLDLKNIVHRVYDTGPLTRASREEMIAAEYALEEFRTNLSRLEPYVQASGDTAAYPERRHARGSTGEVVGGLQKETFEGAIMKVEGGASVSDFSFGDVDERAGESATDRGSGGLVRARVEVPFIGSRKRQERVISQAFQESQARKARLDYLSNFRLYVNEALGYYLYALLYRDYGNNWETQAQTIEDILKDPRVRAADKARLTTTMDSNRVTRDQYRTYQRTQSLLLLSMLGVPMDTSVELSDRAQGPSPYLDRISSPEGRQALIAEAYENNPRFRVLEDAIKDAELQRQQAILGRYDLTAFMEGTQFPFGASTYDDRLGGWLVGGGVNVRLNDSRVLTASRLKAEAAIRQYKAEIESERLLIDRKIIDNGDQLLSYHRIEEDAEAVAHKKEAQFRQRCADYLEGSDPSLTVDDVLGMLGEWTAAENRLASNEYYIGNADLQIMTATGELYRMVGMDIDGKQTAGKNDEGKSKWGN